jgi:hypothetical protein
VFLIYVNFESKRRTSFGSWSVDRTLEPNGRRTRLIAGKGGPGGLGSLDLPGFAAN